VERWIPIVGWESFYAISDAGNVYSYRRKKVLVGFRGGKGYVQITLADIPRRKQRKYIHALVAEAFLPSRPGPRFEVNHINLDKTDNRVVNLEWVAHSRNQAHAASRNRMLKLTQRKLTADQVRLVRVTPPGNDHQFATQLGVSRNVLWRIRNGLAYRDIV